MKCIVTNKKTGERGIVTAMKKKTWMIGGDYPDYKNFYYNLVDDDGSEFELRNGRMVRV